MAEGTDKTFDLSVVTPDGSVFDGEAQMVVVPGDSGEIGVLARHAPLVALLRAGETRIRADGEWRSFATGPGYFKVQKDRAIALVDQAVRAEEIDAAEARREAEEARALVERAEAGEEGIDRWRAEQQLRHAENKLAIAGGGS